MFFLSFSPLSHLVSWVWSWIIYVNLYDPWSGAVPRFTGKTRITGKTAEIPERPKNNRGIFIGVALIESIPDLFYLTLKQ